jgi:hypothetical protein
MPLTSNMNNEWRSPSGGDTLPFADEQYSPFEKENATHGQVYRTGRSCVKLYGGHGGPERETFALAGGGDERRGADPGAARDTRHPASVPGGRHPRELAVRSAFPLRGGDRGGGGAGESGSEERQVGCLRSGRTAPNRGDQAEGLQEAGRVRSAEAPGGACSGPGGWRWQAKGCSQWRSGRHG